MKIFKSIMIASATCVAMAFATSCSGDESVANDAKPVQLELEIGGINTTRSIIDGTTLPEFTQFGIYAAADTIAVNYESGVCHMSRTVYVPSSGLTVYAYYPYSLSNYIADGSFPIYISSQTDYLYAKTSVTETNPKAKIYFNHVLSRVTLKIKKSSTNRNAYKIPSVTLSNLCASARLYTDASSVKASTDSTSVVYKPAEYVLDDSDDVIVADFLVLPGSSANATMSLDNNVKFTATLPSTNWVSGRRYTYNVTIEGEETVTISDVTVEDWGSTTAGKISVND